MTYLQPVGTAVQARLPRLGVSLPAQGDHAGPEAIVEVAQAGERLGFSALSANERLLVPAGEHWNHGAGVHESPAWETLEVLTWAAAHTERIRLATAVINSLFQPPVVLAKRLATLDRLSGGRIDVGLGQGWLAEEFTAAGIPLSRRGVGFEEHLVVMRACWAPDPVEHRGPVYEIPKSVVGPKPFRGSLPVYIGAVAPAAVVRAARIGDGFINVVRDWATSAAQIRAYREAGGTGTVVLRRVASTGDPSAFATAAAADVKEAALVGADEIHWDLNGACRTAREQVDAMTALAEALPDHCRGPLETRDVMGD